jgi:pimeloyl-ACP methyl ester carboxylesterase
MKFEFEPDSRSTGDHPTRIPNKSSVKSRLDSLPSVLKKEIRSSTLILFPESGHSPMMEHRLLFNREMGKFLQAGNPGTSK